jgi:hypothetical protein
MDGQMMMAIYRIEAIIKRVEECTKELEKLQDGSENMSYDQFMRLSGVIDKLKEIK